MAIQTIELRIQGMTCDHCVNAVTGALKGVDGVEDARVKLEDNSAVVKGANVDAAALITAVEEEGYEAQPV